MSIKRNFIVNIVFSLYSVSICTVLVCFAKCTPGFFFSSNESVHQGQNHIICVFVGAADEIKNTIFVVYCVGRSLSPINVLSFVCSWELSANGGGDVAYLAERRTSMLMFQVRFLGAASDFSHRVNFQCRLLWCPYTPVCSHMY